MFSKSTSHVPHVSINPIKSYCSQYLWNKLSVSNFFSPAMFQAARRRLIFELPPFSVWCDLVPLLLCRPWPIPYLDSSIGHFFSVS